MKTKKQISISIATYYFFTMMAYSIVITVIPMYMVELGFSEVQVGIVLALTSLVSVVFTPVWGMLDDMTNKTSWLLSIIVIALGILSLVFGVAKIFVLFLCTRMLFEAFLSGFNPLADKAAIYAELHYNTPYPNMRLFGSLGYSIVLFPVLFLVEYFNNYQIIFMAMLIFYAVAFVASKNMRQIDDEQQAIAHAHPPKMLEAIKHLSSNPSYVLLALIYMLIFCMNDLSGMYQGIHLTKTLGAAPIVVSWAVFLASGVSEVTCFLFAPKVHQRYGWLTCVIISSISFILRFVLESMAMTWPLFLVVKLLNGIAITLLVSPILMLVKRHIAGKYFSTALTMMVALKGIMIAIASFGIGQLIQTTGTTFSMYSVFITMSFITFAGLLVYKYKFYNHNLENEINK